MLVSCLTAIALPLLELHYPQFFGWARCFNWLPKDASMAQLLLGVIAGSCMTLVSVVYSMLLIALTFASMQFSPRILNNFVNDRVSQVTLGLFIGTFAYCMVLLPSFHKAPESDPQLSLLLALLLAAVCMLILIYFIQHIAMVIQVNYIVDRIGTDTERTLRKIFGDPLKSPPRIEDSISIPANGRRISSRRSGYIQFVDEERLLKLAIKSNASIYIHHAVGQFLSSGAPCMTISPAEAADAQLETAGLACFEIGPWRSMDVDVEFGFLQMVDIALKAISPAVNDPGTAICCIDRLCAMLLVAATLEPPITRVYDETGEVRLTRRQPSFTRLLEIAYSQIINYSKTDMAVSLRLLGALEDIATVTDHAPYLVAMRKQGREVVKNCQAHFAEVDCIELKRRLQVLESADPQRATLEIVQKPESKRKT